MGAEHIDEGGGHGLPFDCCERLQPDPAAMDNSTDKPTRFTKQSPPAPSNSFQPTNYDFKSSTTSIRKFHLRASICIYYSIFTIISTSSFTAANLDPSTADCSRPLGMTNSAIKDWQIAASSSKQRSDDHQCAVKYARLHSAGGKAWCAGSAQKSEWLLVDLGVASTISGIVTQGRGAVKEWITNFMVSYSSDAYNWDYARDIYGNKKIFKGNSDSVSLRHSYLEHPVTARFVRVHVVDWHRHPSLRLEIIGCQQCNEVVSVFPYSEITASSSKKWRRHQSCSPEMADLESSKGWCPRKQNDREWLQFDLGPPTTITGLVTRGQGDRKRYVTSYGMSYSNDSVNWYQYKDSNHIDSKTFGGNMDKATERRHYLNNPVTARYIRFHPKTWHKRIGMRAAVIGCRHAGDCGPGFMRVNAGSSCVANKAFDHETWVNDKRHDWKEWRYGHSSLAVDGKLDTSLSNCAIMDNYYVEQPVWMVDLGKKTNVNGIIALTWQGAGQDKITAYADYVYNLDKLTAYVSNKGELSAERLSHSNKCASITRLNNALFNPRIHFDCPRSIEGRYLYIKASGVPDRWRRTFTVVLCEVMVY